jgi:hypothetical protein
MRNHLEVTTRWVSLLSILIFIAGCTTAYTPPPPKDEFSVWLSEAPRTIALDVDPELPRPDLMSRDRKVGERIAKGAGGGIAGAGYVFLSGCASGGPFGCLAGLLLSPVGFVAGAAGGAVSVDTEVTHQPLSDQKGAASVFEPKGKPLKIPKILSTSILAAGAKVSSHVILVAGKYESGKVNSRIDAKLNISLSTLSLLGEVGKNPSLALAVKGSAYLSAPAIPRNSYYTFSYEGSSRLLSEWRANNSLLFRKEITKATKIMASEIVNNLLNDSPSDEVVTEVMAARERRQKTFEPVKYRSTQEEMKPKESSWPPILLTEPEVGAIPYQDVVYVDDGSCPKGQIKKLTGGSENWGLDHERDCIPNPTKPKRFSDGPVTGDELARLLIGLQLTASENRYISGRSLAGSAGDCYLSIKFGGDHKLSGDCIGTYGGEADSGRWNITGQGRLCLKWSAFFDGIEQCYRVAKKGDTIVLRNKTDQVAI